MIWYELTDGMEGVEIEDDEVLRWLRLACCGLSAEEGFDPFLDLLKFGLGIDGSVGSILFDGHDD